MKKQRRSWVIAGLATIALLATVAVACSSAVDENGGTGPSGDTGSAGPAQDDFGIQPSDGGAPPLDAGEARDSTFGGDGFTVSNSGTEPSAGTTSGPDLQVLLDRKVIQSVSLDLDVEEVGRAFTEVIRIAETAGGFVSSSTFSNVDDEQVADLTIRVPANGYQSVLAEIRGMGELQSENSDANDVTEEFTDLQARLRTLEATEQRYLDLLAEADGINEILTVQDRLDGVRGQIEQVQGRMNLLNNLTDLATITVHLRPITAVAEAPVDGGGIDPAEAAADAWETSLDTLGVLAVIVVAIAAYSWWLVPPLAVLAIAARWWTRRHPQAPSQTPSA